MELRGTYRFPFSRYPAVRVALLLVCGIWAASILPVPGTAGFDTAVSQTSVAGTTLPGTTISGRAVALFGAWLIVFAGFWAYSRRHVSVLNTSLLTLLYLAGIVLFGWFRMHSAEKTMPEAVRIVLGFEQETLHFDGRLVSVSINQHGTLNGIIRVDSVMIGAWTLPVGALFRYRMFNADPSLANSLLPAMMVSGQGSPRPFRERRNPHEFDFREWNRRQQIHGEIVLGNIRQEHSQARFLAAGWVPVRLAAYRLIDTVFREENRPLAKAVLLGYKAELDSGTRQSFSRAGLSHIMAVSGMHVGFVLMPVWLLFPWLRSTTAGKASALALLFLVLLFYAGITGFTASVNRASLMAVLLATGSVFCKIRDSLNLVGMAAIVLLVYDPWYLYDVGFQLSFTAVTIILVSLPVLQRMIPRRIRYTWRGNILTMFGLSVLIQGGLYPILTLYFREFSLIGPLLNILAVPLAQGLFLAAFVSLPIAAFSAQAGALAGFPADLMLTGLSILVDLANGRIQGWITAPRPTLVLFIVWVFAFGLFASVRIPSIRWKMALLLLVTLCLWRAEAFLGEWRNNALEIVFFDVGQGDAALIRTPAGRTILYDTGVLNPFADSGRNVLLPYLEDAGIKRIDAVILSHPHADHIGGILSLIGKIDIGVIYQSPVEYHSAVFFGYMEAAKRHGIPVQELRLGDVPELDPGLLALVMAPVPGLQSRDPNAHSVVIRLQYGDAIFLLTGDAEEVSERGMQATFGSFLGSHLLKAGHHGSHTSSHSFFLDEVRPEAVVVSSAIRNRYNHPHRAAVERIVASGADLWYTALDGAIVIRSDGYGFTRHHWRD
jgi:competence protein ComEC